MGIQAPPPPWLTWRATRWCLLSASLLAAQRRRSPHPDRRLARPGQPEGGRAACVSTTGTKAACARGRAVVTPRSLIVGADGKHVYVAPSDRSREAMAIFDRATRRHADATRGRAGCVSETGLRRLCGRASGMRAPRDLVNSPDGRNVYVATTSGAIAVLHRDTTSETLKQRRGRTGGVSRGARSFRRPARRVVDEHSRRRSR